MDAKCPDLVSLTFHIFESKRGKWQAVSPPFSIFILHIILIALSSHIYIFFPREAALAAARSHCSIARIKCFIQLTLLHTILRGLQLWRENKSSKGEGKKRRVSCIWMPNHEHDLSDSQHIYQRRAVRAVMSHSRWWRPMVVHRLPGHSLSPFITGPINVQPSRQKSELNPLPCWVSQCVFMRHYHVLDKKITNSIT